MGKLASRKFLLALGAIIATSITAHPSIAPYLIVGVAIVYVIAEAVLDRLGIPTVTIDKVLSSAVAGLAGEGPSSLFSGSVKVTGAPNSKPADIAVAVVSQLAATVLPPAPTSGTPPTVKAASRPPVSVEVTSSAAVEDRLKALEEHAESHTHHTGIGPTTTAGLVGTTVTATPDAPPTPDTNDATATPAASAPSTSPATAPSASSSAASKAVAAAGAVVTTLVLICAGLIVLAMTACGLAKEAKDAESSAADPCSQITLASIENSYTDDVRTECAGQTFDGCTARPAIEAKYAAKREEWSKCQH